MSKNHGKSGADTAGGEEIRLELDRFFPYRLTILQRSVSRVIAQVYAEEFQLGVHEWRAMAVLGNEEPLSANDICARANLGKVQVSRAIARLLERGLIVRKLSREDRRRSELRLTAKGRDIYGRIVPRARAREKELLEVLSAGEAAQLDRLVEKLHSRAGELLQDCDGRRAGSER